MCYGYEGYFRDQEESTRRHQQLELLERLAQERRDRQERETLRAAQEAELERLAQTLKPDKVVTRR
jgi:hypothetical protein